MTGSRRRRLQLFWACALFGTLCFAGLSGAVSLSAYGTTGPHVESPKGVDKGLGGSPRKEGLGGSPRRVLRISTAENEPPGGEEREDGSDGSSPLKLEKRSGLDDVEGLVKKSRKESVKPSLKLTIDDSGPKGETVERSRQVDFAHNDDFWSKVEGHRAKPGCEWDCWPQRADAPLPCHPSCVFTDYKGFGVPTTVTNAFKAKEPPRSERPVFFVSFGPPGSGKSKVAEWVTLFHARRAEAFREGWTKHLIEVNVDALMHRLLSYHSEREAIHKLDPRPLYTQRYYWYLRWTADQLSDQVLYKALAHRYHILWETTGESIAWTVDVMREVASMGYVVHVVYPYVPLDTLQIRLEKRALTEGQEAAPKETMALKVTRALDNFKSLVTRLKGDDFDYWLVDNSREGGSGKLVYAAHRKGTAFECAEFEQFLRENAELPLSGLPC